MIDFTPPIPTPVVQFVQENFIIDNEYGGIAYIMEWKGEKIYSPSLAHSPETGLLYSISKPIFITFDGKKAERLHPFVYADNIEQQYYKYYIKRTKNCYKKLDTNLDKTQNIMLEITENIESPKIPNAVTKYADKYILKHKKRKIEYLYTWNGISAYRIYYQIKPQTFPHQKIILLYDGKIVRRATEDEMKIYCHECSDYYHYSRFSKYKNDKEGQNKSCPSDNVIKERV